ncbi:MAG: RimK family alpha-L-glutamate ligase [Lachnospiraceae bacterium]|nr:RimK family alpha-L-glutamate ligase [Lachnospiraceae bacterium]
MINGKYAGIVIYNTFLNTKKYSEHVDWLLDAAKRHDILLMPVGNSDIISVINPDGEVKCALSSAVNLLKYGFIESPDELQDEYAAINKIDEDSQNSESLIEDSYDSESLIEDSQDSESLIKDSHHFNIDLLDFIIYWDKDIRLGKLLEESLDAKFFNAIDSVAICDDKYETYLKLSKWNKENPDKKLNLIKTILVPMTYENIGFSKFDDNSLDFIKKIGDTLSYPFIIKECFGSFGAQVYKADNEKEAVNIIKAHERHPLICQEYIEESKGEDVRIQVVGDRVVCAMHRKANNDDFRANITNGGTAYNYEPSEKEKEIALNVTKALGLTFTGVDLLFSDKKAEIVCEVNSNAHFKNISECTGINVAEEIISYICDCLVNSKHS